MPHESAHVQLLTLTSTVTYQIITGKIPFEELSKVTAIILHTINGKLPAIRDDMDLSHVLKLCSLMSECWALEPSKRICASAFQRSVDMMVSTLLRSDGFSYELSNRCSAFGDSFRLHLWRSENTIRSPLTPSGRNL